MVYIWINRASPIKQQLKLYFYLILMFSYNGGEDQKGTFSQKIIFQVFSTRFVTNRYTGIIPWHTYREFWGTEENFNKYIHISNIASSHKKPHTCSTPFSERVYKIFRELSTAIWTTGSEKARNQQINTGFGENKFKTEYL